MALPAASLAASLPASMALVAASLAASAAAPTAAEAAPAAASAAPAPAAVAAEAAPAAAPAAAPTAAEAALLAASTAAAAGAAAGAAGAAGAISSFLPQAARATAATRAAKTRDFFISSSFGYKQFPEKSCQRRLASRTSTDRAERARALSVQPTIICRISHSLKQVATTAIARRAEGKPLLDPLSCAFSCAKRCLCAGFKYPKCWRQMPARRATTARAGFRARPAGAQPRC
jgi:hypothetical protein